MWKSERVGQRVCPRREARASIFSNAGDLTFCSELVSFFLTVGSEPKGWEARAFITKTTD